MALCSPFPTTSQLTPSPPRILLAKLYRLTTERTQCLSTPLSKSSPAPMNSLPPRTCWKCPLGRRNTSRGGFLIIRRWRGKSAPGATRRTKTKPRMMTRQGFPRIPLLPLRQITAPRCIPLVQAASLHQGFWYQPSARLVPGAPRCVPPQLHVLHPQPPRPPRRAV